MDGFQKPRHIRDIAHLYISRRAMAEDERRRRVYVAAATRECFGAYHAANLALGFAQKGLDVELLELSRVLPCSGYFLRLPPSVYIKHKDQSPHEALSALGGVNIRFAAPRTTGDDPARGISVGSRRRTTGTVEVFHLPPTSDLDSIERALQEIDAADGNRAPAQVRAIVIAKSDSDALEAGRLVFGDRPAVDWATLSLDGKRRLRDGAHNGFRSLGYISGWRSLLSDPLPCVMRDPGSHVSRCYLMVCDALLSTGRVVKGRNEDKIPRRTASVGRIR
jgi:hypothetical protein